ncbi:arylsulfatase [Opitutales bacterium]|jgi:arylsulfatase A|nr:arylsulfatase [Opitutales bacterium]
MKPLLLFLLPLFALGQVSNRPNVVLFMADDMGMGDTSAYKFFTKNTDDQQLKTPAMQRLADGGMLFTDAHTPSSRCTPTRYGLLTGRYPWRARMKHWVLFGVQGDPLIEKDRPTLGTLFRSQDYATAMVGKWHLGLRYTQSDGKPAAGWDDADLTKGITDGPAAHGFDYARFTSRSHGTSGLDAGTTVPKSGRNKRGDQNTPKQRTGPGHVHNNQIVSANGNGKQLFKKGPHAYDFHSLGSRHSDHAITFLDNHFEGKDSSVKPFFLYYPSNSNHGPYTPDKKIGNKAVKGAGRTMSGQATSIRLDYIYENDVALGRLLDYLQNTDDPRNKGSKLIENTIVIFTSDNGAEVTAKTATGQVRSNKGSCFEGGHRVPFIVSWPKGKIGKGKVSEQLIGLQDLYATFSEIMGASLPDLKKGEKGAEDSLSLLPAWQGKKLVDRPMFYNDHKESKDGAACAMRLDNPKVGGKVAQGKWKMFFDASLLRLGKANPTMLFDLATDPKEGKNRLDAPSLKPLVKRLVSTALLHRRAGGHRFVPFAPKKRLTFDWTKPISSPTPIVMNLLAKGGKASMDPDGVGIHGSGSDRVDAGQAIVIRFKQDVLIESVGLKAGKDGTCGGSLLMGKRAPLAIYCTDKDNDAKNQQGIISDLGILKKGEMLILDANPHLGVETAGSWKLQSLVVRPLAE